MGGNSRQKKSTNSSSFSVFNLFKSRRARRSGDDYYNTHDDAPSARSRVWPSDEDRGEWGVAKPGIDKIAEAFIAKIHKNIATDSEWKTVTIPSTNSTSTAAKA